MFRSFTQLATRQILLLVEKIRAHPLALATGLFSTFLFAMAYPIFSNVMEGVHPSVSFTGFTIIAFVSSLWVPRTGVRPSFMPEIHSWRHSFSKSGVGVVLLSGVFYVAAFAVLLPALQDTSAGAVVTVTVLQLCLPPTITLLSRFVLQEKFAFMPWFIGVVCVLLGLICFQFMDLFLSGETLLEGVDRVFLLTMLYCVFTAVEDLAKGWARRGDRKMHHFNVLTTQFLVGSILGPVWVQYSVSDGLSQFLHLTLEQWGALLVLGVFSTALAIGLYNWVQDQIGYAAADALVSPKPLFVFLLGLIPLSWLHDPDTSFGVWQGVGAALAIMGAFIVTFLAKSESAITQSDSLSPDD